MVATSEPILGSVVPRIYTPERRDLNPATSDGFAVIEFARDVLGVALDEWQAWLVIHALERLEDGRPRFRRVVCLVSRQAGKSTLLAVLACWWLWRDPDVELILGTSHTESGAREAWDKALGFAEDAGLDIGKVITANGRVELKTAEGGRYKIAASNRRGGRGLSLDRAILDELREHRSRDAWDAVSHAMNARPRAQLWAVSNAGDDQAVTLWSLRDEALENLDNPDSRIGIFEWSAEEGLAADDPVAWQQAQPQLGRRVEVEVYEAAARRAVLAGGEELSRFEVELLCRKVKVMNPAMDANAWLRYVDVGDLDAVRDRVALCVDLSPDRLHASAVAAAVLPDGRARVEVVDAWDGPSAGESLRRALPDLVAKVKPNGVAWYPDGPAASLLADMRPRPGVWPPPGITVAPLKSETDGACMAFASDVAAGRIVHSGDPLLDAHVTAAERFPRPGGTWRFSRKAGQCDAAYAAAGAVYLARTLPVAPPVRDFIFID